MYPYLVYILVYTLIWYPGVYPYLVYTPVYTLICLGRTRVGNRVNLKYLSYEHTLKRFPSPQKAMSPDERGGGGEGNVGWAPVVIEDVQRACDGETYWGLGRYGVVLRPFLLLPIHRMDWGRSGSTKPKREYFFRAVR